MNYDRIYGKTLTDEETHTEYDKMSTISLADKCVYCSNNLYAYYNRTCNDDITAGKWNIKCTKCEESDNEYFPYGNIGGLEEDFIILEESIERH